MNFGYVCIHVYVHIKVDPAKTGFDGFCPPHSPKKETTRLSWVFAEWASTRVSCHPGCSRKESPPSYRADDGCQVGGLPQLACLPAGLEVKELCLLVSERKQSGKNALTFFIHRDYLVCT